MALREYFRKNIQNDVVVGENAKMIGSFSRDYVYPTDIDFISMIDKNYYDMLMEKITKKYEHTFFLYITFFVNIYKDIKIEVKDKNNFSNIDFNNIQKQLTKLYNNNILNSEKYNKLISYTVNINLKNILKLELELNSYMKIKWFIHDVKKGYKVVDGITYNFKEMTEKDKDCYYTFILHWLWNVKKNEIVKDNTFFLVDIGVVFKSMFDCFKKNKGKKYTFYKDMYILYYENDYYYMVKGLIYVAIEYRNFKIVKMLHKIVEVDYGIHKQSFNKLYEISKLKSDDFKDLNIDDIADSALNTVKFNLKKINFNYNDSLTILENRQNLINYTNESIKDHYNKYRQILVNHYPQLNSMLPPKL